MGRVLRSIRSYIWRALPEPVLNALGPMSRTLRARWYKQDLSLRGDRAAAGKSYIELVLRFFPRSGETLCDGANQAIFFNVASLQTVPTRTLKAAIRQAFQRASEQAAQVKQALRVCLDVQSLCLDLVDAPAGTDVGFIDRVLEILADYQACSGSLARSANWSKKPPLPQYDAATHRATVRFGPVELRVVENYLFERSRLKEALQRVVQNLQSERMMYAPPRASTPLLCDDAEWCLRTLMTNAGFYAAPDPVAAWAALEDWVTRYIASLRASHLAWSSKFASYFFKSQNFMRLEFGYAPRYVRMPDHPRLYAQFADRRVLFLTPLAHLVDDQATSGRLWRLYRDRRITPFSVTAVPAYVSTWPNRPHRDWSETFAQLCASIDAAFTASRFDVFLAACGCYGLPVCEYVRERYGCAVLYIGNRAHTLFGIRQKTTPDLPNVDPEMWVASDLARYPSMDRIDGGRYI